MANWQNYTPNPQSGWQASQQYPSSFGQNGGISQGPQQPELPFVGRYINNIGEVMPREVPMDGRAAIFPTQTLEEIYLKAWDRNGTIKTFRYILDPTQNLNAQGTVQEPDMNARILERLEQLEQRLGEAQAPRSGNRRTNKGGEDNAQP